MARNLRNVAGGRSITISPEKVSEEAKRLEDENYCLRSYLKSHAEEEELDERFFRLHKELFGQYDCSKCRNCCKMYKGSMKDQDIVMVAKKLGISMERVKDFFLTYNECEDNYETKYKPCDFLMEDGECKLEEVRPDNCKDYPYTN
jgi:hypothetical protein